MKKWIKILLPYIFLANNSMYRKFIQVYANLQQHDFEQVISEPGLNSTRNKRKRSLKNVWTNISNDPGLSCWGLRPKWSSNLSPICDYQSFFLNFLKKVVMMFPCWWCCLLLPFRHQQLRPWLAGGFDSRPEKTASSWSITLLWKAWILMIYYFPFFGILLR